MENLDLPDFEVVDKGVEIQDEGKSAENSDKRSISSEVVKEIVHNQFHLTRLTELDSNAQQIKALKSMMGEEKADKTDEETASQISDADEEIITIEFLQMLEGVEASKFKIDPEILTPKVESNENKEETESTFSYQISGRDWAA
ncbi:Transcription factor MYB98 [Olea europaea subsp. europaea]|uniref:Transcription factor MYB98 n=1 Tax=Olea europaea subsp. europaea TaxID=158383 RepID=A0A8S0TM08_OLEEU|nr:Transcription factor MYB98 [Olea europaea subsp. europaea]